jgi:hypothetical protein
MAGETKERYSKGISRALRIKEVNEIYDLYARTGLSNREIWRRYIYPRFGITEATFYNYLSAPFQEALNAV